MSGFQRKDSLTKTISFMALMAAINIVLSLVAAFVPFLSVVLVIFLPLTTALVELTCKDRYFPIYAIGTVGLAFAATFWNFDFTIFYLIPSIITGYIFGLMTKKNISTIWTVLSASVIQTLLMFLFVPIMLVLTERNFIDDISTLLGLSGWAEFNDYVIVLFFGISLIQTILSYLATSSELKRMKISNENSLEIDSIAKYAIFVPFIASIVFFFINKGLSYFFIVVSFYFAYFLVFDVCKKKDWLKLIIFGVIVFLNFFFFAIFNPLLKQGQMLLLLFTPIFIEIFYIINTENWGIKKKQ